jgi:CheY-like chemotaxis protein
MRHMLLRLKVGSVTTCGSGQAALEELETNYTAITNTSDITTTTVSSTASGTNTAANSAAVSDVTSGSGGSLSSSNNSSSKRINLVLTDIQMPVSYCIDCIETLHSMRYCTASANWLECLNGSLNRYSNVNSSSSHCA